MKEMKFGSLKPMCLGCFRRVYGRAKDGGWWCGNCDDWIVPPPKKAKKKPRSRAGGER